MTFSEAAGRAIVYARSGGVCEVCHRGGASEWHHRVPRSGGGEWAPGNGLHLCSWCHRWITEHPAHAVDLGLALLRSHDPLAIPAWHYPLMFRRDWWLLDNDGCLTWTLPPEHDVASAQRALALARFALSPSP